METAYLSSKGRYTFFRYGDMELRFIAPYSLERYKEMYQKWSEYSATGFYRGE